MARNSPGSGRIGAPIFIAQGSSDNVVDPPVTKAYARHLCSNGETVDYHELQGIDHGMAARKSSSRAVGWMLERFEGRTANGCQFR
jgi:dipeptidyl aminopeptidase/acylaminoacyl peptidase